MSALALVLASCSPAPSPAPTPSAPSLPALGVLRVSHVDGDAGFVAEDSPFVVVLTRPVAPVPDALSLVDSARGALPGTTVWLDRQLAVFYPAERLARGRELVLRSTAPLRATDGSTLAPRELAAVETRPIALLRARVAGGTLDPMGRISLSFEPLAVGVRAADVSAHAVITADGAPVPFRARDEGHEVVLTAEQGFPPGREIRLAWREGPVATTSVGRARLPPFVTRSRAGLTVKVGEEDDHCVLGMRDVWRCATTRASITFATPIPDEELARHVHPPLVRKNRGDTRGHRFELVLTDAKPAKLTLDAELTDAFGQRLGAKRTLAIGPML